MSEKKTYRVLGTRTYRGVSPGETFSAELSPGAEARAVARGAIEVANGNGGGLESKNRKELNAIASAAGVDDPESLNDKAAVVQAIRDNE